jgi:hypothetical protein
VDFIDVFQILPPTCFGKWLLFQGVVGALQATRAMSVWSWTTGHTGWIIIRIRISTILYMYCKLEITCFTVLSQRDVTCDTMLAGYPY